MSNKNVDIKFSAHNTFLEVRSKSKDWKANLRDLLPNFQIKS